MIATNIVDGDGNQSGFKHFKAYLKGREELLLKGYIVRNSTNVSIVDGNEKISSTMYETSRLKYNSLSLAKLHETTQTIILKQTDEGSFCLSDILSEILDTKSELFTSTIQTYAWTTAITICYLKIRDSSHEETWKVQYEKARKYLSEQIKDAELEEELALKLLKKKQPKNCSIKIYVVVKLEIIYYDNGKFFGVLLVDQSGEIIATTFDLYVDEFYNWIEKNKRITLWGNHTELEVDSIKYVRLIAGVSKFKNI
ncbi:7290_t:CDS:2 [Entrophospora sp. SA101]|nr:7290_t:CDS:2 [Entrophospora sp. SA101]